MKETGKIIYKSTSAGFGGFSGLMFILQIIFIVLKVTSIISWSWLVVLIPSMLILLSWLIGLGIFLITFVIVIVIAIIKAAIGE